MAHLEGARAAVAVHIKVREPGKPAIPIEGLGSWTVAKLKTVIMEETGIPVEQQQLTFAGADLTDDTKLSALLFGPAGSGLIVATGSGEKGAGEGELQKGDSYILFPAAERGP